MYVIPLTKSGAIRNDTNTSQRDPTLISTGVDFNDYEMIEFFDIDYYTDFETSGYDAPIDLNLKNYKAVNVYCDTTLVSKKNEDALCGSSLNPFIDFEEAYTHCVCLVRSICCNTLFRIRINGSINYWSRNDYTVPELFGNRILVSSYDSNKLPIKLISDPSIWGGSLNSISYFLSLYDTTLITESPIFQSSIDQTNTNQYRSIGLNFIYNSEIQYYYVVDTEFSALKDRIYFFRRNLATYGSTLLLNITYKNLTNASIRAYSGYFDSIFFNGYVYWYNLLCSSSNIYIYSEIGLPQLGYSTIQDTNIIINVNHSLSIFENLPAGSCVAVSSIWSFNVDIEFFGDVCFSALTVLGSMSVDTISIVSNTTHSFGNIYAIQSVQKKFKDVYINVNTTNCIFAWGASINGSLNINIEDSTILVSNQCSSDTFTNTFLNGLEIYRPENCLIENTTILCKNLLNVNYGGSCRTYAVRVMDASASTIIFLNSNKTASASINTAHLPTENGWGYSTVEEAYSMYDVFGFLEDCYYIVRSYDGAGNLYEEINGCN